MDIRISVTVRFCLFFLIGVLSNQAGAARYAFEEMNTGLNVAGKR